MMEPFQRDRHPAAAFQLLSMVCLLSMAALRPAGADELHAKDDALVSCEHAEFAHRNIPQSKLVLFETGGHALLSQMNEFRKHVSIFLNEQVPSLRCPLKP